MSQMKTNLCVAKSAGFCFGVKRAVNMVYHNACKKNVYTYGPIIHNEEVVKDLEEKGVQVIETFDELLHITTGTVIIRSHGVGKEVYNAILSQGLECIDATCPYVKKIHEIVRKNSSEGKEILIVGNDKHPEVEGIKGWSEKPPIVIENRQDADTVRLNMQKNYCIVSQTTVNYNKFQELVEILLKKDYNLLMYNTICDATEKRQKEASEIAEKVEAMIVIGGAKSSNTQKLYEICKQKCENTYYIQTLVDLDLDHLKSFHNVGITAGASTPNKIIEEVVGNMAERSFEEMLDESFVMIHNGQKVLGKVISVKEDEIILDIGYKSEGIITRNEYTNVTNADLTKLVQVGDELEAKVKSVKDSEGIVLLSYKKLATEKSNKILEDAFNERKVLTAKVTQVLEGGLSVSVEESKVFIPASLISDAYEKDLNVYAGQEIEFVITEFNPKRRRIIGDRKQLIMAKKKEKAKELFEKISVGMIVDGIVKNVTDFGAFVDLGGADGLLHISEMSWGRVENPKKNFKIGETIQVLIKDIVNEKIALSLKFPEQNPWVTAVVKYAVGNVVSGRVARMTEFGAFIELEPGVDALLHVSQISKEHVEKPQNVLKIGQEITAQVVDFNDEDKKISLSMKALEQDEETEDAQDFDEQPVENNEEV